MADVDIINGIWWVVTDNTDFLTSIGLNPATATIDQKAQKVQREREPDGLATQNIPLVCIYPVPGLKKRFNYTVYEAEFQIDFYAKSLFLAMTSGKIAMNLLNNTTPPVDGGFVFDCEFLDGAAGESGVTGIKKYCQRYMINDVIVRD